MARKLPPLNSLPCFEAAARLLNFSKAADELSVTPGAISRAVKHLEDQLDVLLFERKTRSMQLTAVGESYARAVRDALDRLATATALATARSSDSTLNVSTSDGFAGRWLVPRLYRFHRAHGGIDVRVSTTGKLTTSWVTASTSPSVMAAATIPASRQSSSPTRKCSPSAAQSC